MPRAAVRSSQRLRRCRRRAVRLTGLMPWRQHWKRRLRAMMLMLAATSLVVAAANAGVGRQAVAVIETAVAVVTRHLLVVDAAVAHVGRHLAAETATWRLHGHVIVLGVLVVSVHLPGDMAPSRWHAPPCAQLMQRLCTHS